MITAGKATESLIKRVRCTEPNTFNKQEHSEVAMNVDKQRKGFRIWGHGVREPVNKLLSFLVVFNFGRLSTLPPASVSNTSKPDIDLLCCFPAIAEENNVIMSQAIPKSGDFFLQLRIFFAEPPAQHWSRSKITEENPKWMNRMD